MVRETRHLWVGNLPDNIREDRIREHFKRYGRVQSVKLLPPRGSSGSGSGTSGTGSGSEEGGGGLCAAVAFMDIKSASKAHTAEHKLDERSLTTEYYEPPTAAILHLHESTPSGPVTPTSGVTATVGTGGVYPPRSPRFPHGPAEEFERSSHFYRAGVGPVGAVSGPEVEGYLPRRPGQGVPNYPDGLRGRARDRQQTYRNGPSYQPPHIETGRGAGAASHHRAGSGGGSGGAWSYESSGTRYPGGVDPEETSRQSAVPCTPSSPATSVTATSPSQAAPSAPAAMLTLNSASASAARKSRHAKRRRGSGRTVGSGGVSDSEQSSGRGSRSSSRSSCSSSPAASSSSSNSSRSTSPGGSPRGRSRLPMPPPSHHNSTHAEDRRPLAICVRNLPARSSDTSLKDGLFHEYKKHGKVTWVKVVGTGGDRYALVCFKKPEDVDKALEVSHDKLFFGCKIDVAPYEGFDVEDNDFRPYEAELDEFHPKATRTLFIGNLEKDVTAAELRKHFEQFGEIIEIDIKKQGSVSSYAFCQYADIGAVVAAMRSMDGEHLGNNRIKLGFGKSMPTNCVWVDGVAGEKNVSEKYLSMQFHQFGPLAQVAVDRARGHALVFFEQLSCAQAAVKELRGVAIRGRRLQLDFASRECQEAFYAHLEKQGSPSERVWERPPATFDAREPVVPRFEGVPPVAAPVNARFTPRYEASVRGSARGGPHGAHRGAATGPATTQRAGRAGRQPPPRFADFYDEFAVDRTRFRPGSGEEYLSHEEGGSYEQELRDYGYCQRERRTDYPGDSEHSPSPAQLAPEEGTEDAATSSSIPIPARRHSRQHSTASEHDSPPRHPSPPPGKRIHPRLLSCSPRTPYYEDKESDATKNKDSLSPTPSSNVTSIISGSKCDLNSCNRGPHRHVDGKEPPPPVPPPLPSLPPPRSGVTPLPPPSAPESDMKHLQKERVHIKQLLDQLGESQSSSGDESVNNKRLKLNNEHNKVIINNNNSQGSSSTESAVDKSECGVVNNTIPFRKIIEPRRLSDLKGRRISTDSDKYHHRGDYAPSHFIPKRRKTESSSEGGDGEHHGHPPHRDSSDGSRPGTPLCDERPESLIPSEPRRPRERSSDGPISLPLPKFAHQLLSPRPGCGGPGKIVYSIKSPPSLPPPLRHRIEPPPRNEEKKESASGESATSEIPMSPSRPDSASETERSPRASPTLEERIRMLDEKYEKWSGSRTLLSTTLSTEVMHKKDGEKFKLRTKLPDLNELRSQPSEIVKSVLAKRSVFDEDTKRLENYNEKYEPKDFASTSWRSVAAVATTNKTLVAPTSILKTEVKSEVASPSWSKTKPLLSTIPLPTSSPSSTSPPVITSPKSILVTARTTTPKSPFSTGTPTIPVVPPKPNPVAPQQVKPVVVPPKTVPSPTTSPRPSAKGLQYPFPSHPPVLSPVVPGSPRCQPPLSSPVQCSPALESTDWPPAQPPGLPTPPPSACGSPCIPTTAPPPLPSEEPPQLNKTAIKKENNIISRDPTPVKTISSTSSSSITTSSITSSVVKKENPSIISTTNLSSTITPIKIETPITPPVEIKQEVHSPPPCAPISRKDSQSSSSSSTSSTSSTSSSSATSNKKESSHKPHHKSHSQDRVARSEERRESTEERTRTKERHNSGKEHRPASVGSKRRISSQDEPQHKELVIASIEQPETKRPKLSPSNSTDKSLKAIKATPDRRDSKDGSRKVESSKKSEERRKHSSEKSDKSERDKKSDDKSKTSEEKSRTSEEKTKSSEEKSKSSEEKSKSDEKLRTFEEKSKCAEEKSSRISEEKPSRNSEEKSSRSSEEKSSRSSEEKSSRSPDEKSSRSPDEKSSRSPEEKFSRSSEEKSSRSSEEKSSRSSEEKTSRSSEEKSSRSPEEKSSRSSEEKTSRSSEEKSSRSPEEKSLRSSEEKSSRSSEEKSSRSSEEKSSRNCDDKTSRSLEDRSSRNSEEKSSRNSEEKSSRSSEEKSSRNSEEKSSRTSEEKSSRNPEDKTRSSEEKLRSEEKSSRSSEEKSSRSSEEKSRSSEEKSRSSEEKPRSSEEKSRSSEEKTRDEKSSHDRKSHSEKKQTHSNPSSQNSQAERGDGERHKSKERKRSKSERERSGDVRRPEDKQRSKDEGRERSKHDPDDKNKSSSKQRDKKSDKSDKNRRSESERRKERSTPKKTSSQPSPPAPSTPVTPQPLPQQSTPPQTCQEQLVQSLPRPHRDSANSDSDLSEEGRLKKHSIFDIVDDEPAYISMYDKVKARSTKNMQKQEEEKQKERLKEKFNQLKQSRAKREEKKRSTSWDEDSDSDGTGLNKQDRLAKPSKRHGKLVITSSSEDEGGEQRRSRLPICSDITNSDESEHELKMKQRNHRDRNPRLLKSEPDNTDDDDGDGSARTLLLHAARRNFKPKITSDTSDYDDHQKYKPSPNFDIYSDSDGDKHHITSTPFNTPAIAKEKTKLENSLEIFESSDEGNKFDKKHFDVKFKHEFSENEAPNSLGSSERIHGNCLDKQQRKSHKKSKRRLSGKNNCTVTEQALITTDELEVRLERLDESRLRLGDHKRPSEEKQQRSSAEPEKVEHNKTEHKQRSIGEPEKLEHNKTEHKQRSSADSEHKKHSKRERRRSGHHEEKGELESSKTSSKARKKKSKKDSANVKSESKQRDDKMEDIFGPLSDDSEPEAVQTIHAEAKLTPANNNNTYNSACTRKWQFNSVYSSDSDTNVDASLIQRSSPSLPVVPQVKVEAPEITPITPPAVESGARRAEEKRRKRERRSRERRERKLQREIKSERADDDLAEAGRAIESQLQEDSAAPPPPRPPLAPPSSQQSFDVFHFTDDESASAESCERTKEKKKKRKRSKEERSRKEHHDKSNREVDHDRKSLSRSSEESCKLPNLLPSPTSPTFSPEPVKTTVPKFEEETVSEEHKFEPVLKPTVVLEKKRPEKLIPGFGTDVDAAIHETAVKSISSFDEEPVLVTEPTPAPPALLCQRDVTPEQQDKDDKPRTVISQEETEDAVAALLEETFDFRRYSDEVDEEATPHHHEPQPIPQEDQQLPSEEVEKETQQAVQSLECELPLVTVATPTPAAPDHDSKQHKEEEERADTPQSEHDLQIDESVQPCSEDETPASPREVPPPQTPPKSPERPPSSPPDIMDFSRPPKTPDLPAAFYQQQQQQQQQQQLLPESGVEEKLVELPQVLDKVEEEKEVVPEVTPAPEIKETIPEIKETVPEVKETILEIKKPVPEIKETVPEIEEIVPEMKETVPEIKETVPEIKETIPEIKETIPEIKETIPEVKPVEPVEEEKKEIVETPVVKEEVKVPSPAPPVIVLEPESVVPVKESVPPPPPPPLPPPAEELKVEEVKEEVKEETVEAPVVTPEVPQSPLKVRKVELSAPLMQAMQDAAATPTLIITPEEHNTVEEEEKNCEVSPRCVRGGRGGGRGGRGRGKAASRGGVSTRRSARGGRVGTMPRPEADHSHTEESAEEKSGETDHSLRGRKSKRGRKKKSESGDDKFKPKSSETNDIYEFHDTDDEDVHFETKPGEKPAVLSPPPPPPPPPPLLLLPPPSTVTVTVPVKPEEPPKAPTPPPEEVPPVPEAPPARRDSATDDGSGRPRLILTIKSPMKECAAKVETREEFEQHSEASDFSESMTSPHAPLANVKSPNGPTRKSRRLQEKDSSRSTVDDIIEDVVRASYIGDSAPTSPSPVEQTRTTRRSVRTTRLRGPEEPITAPSQRPVRTSKSDDEKQDVLKPPPVMKIDIPKPATATPNAMPQAAQQLPPVQTGVPSVLNASGVRPLHGPHMLARTHLPGGREEPTTLIDPVTGLLIPMRESEEGQYIPVNTSVSVIQGPPSSDAALKQRMLQKLPVKPVVELPKQGPVASIATPASIPIAHVEPQRVPSVTRVSPPVAPPVRPPATVSMAPGGTVVKLVPLSAAPVPPPPTLTVTKVQQPPTSRPPVTTPSAVSYGAPRGPEMVPGAPYPPWPSQQQSAPSPPGRPPAVKPPPMAHASSHPVISAQPPSAQGARPCHPQPQPAHSASSTPASYGQPDRRDVTHRRVKDEELPLSMLPPRLRVGAVARTSASAALPAPAASSTPSAEPHGLQGCIVASGAPAQPRPPRATSRESSVTGGRPSMAHTAHSQVLQAGLPVPAYEASLGEVVRVVPGQQHPAAGFGVGAPVAHLARAGPVGAPHEVPAHVLHQQLFYQQLLRAQQHHELAPPPPPNSHHHQPAYHLPPAPPGASRSPAVPSLEGKAEAPEASNEALALGPRGHARGPVSPPLELRRAASSGATIPRMPPAAAHLHSPHDRTTDSPQVATVYGGARLVHHPPHLQSGLPRGADPDKHHSVPPSAHPPARSAYLQRAYDEDIIFRHAPPPAHRRHGHPTPGQEAHPAALQQPPQPRLQVQTPPHASPVPPQADSLLMLLQRYPVMWQGLLALKNDQAAVQMHFVFGNPGVARDSLPCNSDGSTPPLRIAQRMRLEQTQLEGVARKMQMEHEHCMLLALPCGRDHMDVLQQSNNLNSGFITYLQQKQAAGIVNIAAPGSQQAAYVVHIFPSCEFANDNLARIAPDLLHRVADISHLLIIIATV